MFAVFLFYRFSAGSNDEKQRTLENNPASYIVIESKDIVVGKDIEPGYYDIKALEDKAEFSGRKMRKNTKLHAVPLWENNRFSIKGEVEFSPSKFEGVKQDENSLIIRNSGYYVVGEEIPEGDYILIKPLDDIHNVFVDVKDEEQTESLYTIQWDQEISQPPGNAQIKLKKGYHLYVKVGDQDNYVADNSKLVLERKE